MPHLTKPQAVVLAMWSYGIAVTRSCGRRTVTEFLALLLREKRGTVEQRLREWCYDAEHKRGKKRIVRLGWHPFLRINQGAKFQPAGQTHWYWLRQLVNKEGQCWRGAGTAFSTAKLHLPCTLVAWWGAGHEEPWFILTDLAAKDCDATWYALRTWCEQGFKCYKRGGWQWQYTRMTDPAGAARLWLALAVATLWVVTLGSELETGPTEMHPELPDLRALLATSLHAGRRRSTRLFRLGWLWLLVQLITAQPLPLPR